MAAGPGLVLLAGTLTFGNEWLQTGQVNYRVPIATLGGAWLISGISDISSKTGTILGLMVLIVAASTPFGGKSPFQELSSAIPKSKG
jgi:hypothetical protein